MRRVYFTDRDLGKQFPARLRDAGLAVERHAELSSMYPEAVGNIVTIRLKNGTVAFWSPYPSIDPARPWSATTTRLPSDW